MINRQFYAMKFNSSRLKVFNYDIHLTFEQALMNGEIIAIDDNQILRSIRDIRENNELDSKRLEVWFAQRDQLRKEKKYNEAATKKIEELDHYIHNMLFMPEYIAIVMEHKSHYRHLFENGLLLNNKKYIRLSCSAGQARESTVIFCEEKVGMKLEIILNNNRDPNIKLTPAKFNAYFGVSGSATKTVSTPNFCVVPDYYSSMKLKVNYVTETDWDKDDLIEIKEVEQKFNRFDGQGLVSYDRASRWAAELGLDYVPAQWCIRQNFIKGMVCTMPPFEKFCREVNDHQYMIKSSYKDQAGNPITVDLREIDCIISESQFKLWDSFDSVETYMENCIKNNLLWGVTSYSPKVDKDILKMNYQFLQTLKLSQKDIEEICEKFVNWISGVNSENIYYTLLFLLGKNINIEKIENYLRNSDNYWVKCLMVNHELLHDKYIKNKIYELIKRRIEQGCLGEVLVDGNFQTIVSDPYAMLQHVCGRAITGLLKKGEHYSHYWNEKGVSVVNSMRAPLTYRSEHLKLNLVKPQFKENETDWYQYCYTGIIVNVFGAETVHWAGSDFDMDILATTSNPNIIGGVYDEELPVLYAPPVSEKMIFNKSDLFKADLFAFGSIIGSITNKSTSGFALLPMFDVESEEYKTIVNRLKMCTKLQSAQIDKAKIGREVKGIPESWIKFSRPNEEDGMEEVKSKAINDRILLNKHPYFFIYLYKDTKARYTKHVKGYELSCQHKFGKSLRELEQQERKTADEQKFLDDYKKYMPVIDSDSEMNRLCKYIESIHFDIKMKLKTDRCSEVYKVYFSSAENEDEHTYRKVVKGYKEFTQSVKEKGNMGVFKSSLSSKYNADIGNQANGDYERFKTKMKEICPRTAELVNHLIRLFYVDLPSSNKDLLWNTFGATIYENVKDKNNKPVLFPMPEPTGKLEYLNKKYKIVEVEI